MIFGKLKGEKKECWACGEKTQNAIIARDKRLPCCTRCVLYLHSQIAEMIFHEYVIYSQYVQNK